MKKDYHQESYEMMEKGVNPSGTGLGLKVFLAVVAVAILLTPFYRVPLNPIHYVPQGNYGMVIDKKDGSLAQRRLLTPGYHILDPLAVDVTLSKVTVIKIGYVGVVIGPKPRILEPGMHYVNPVDVKVFKKSIRITHGKGEEEL